jgi:prepilin-type N-terminal cleavage/methylation domain-containing protein
MTNDRGFTLIEIIISLVVLAILATMVVSYMGSSVRDSVQPTIRLQNTMALQAVMENIRADINNNNDLALLKGAVGSGDQSNIYGDYTVVKNEYIKFNAATNNEEADTPGSTGNDDIDVLKISVKDSSGLTITSFFVEK